MLWGGKKNGREVESGRKTRRETGEGGRVYGEVGTEAEKKRVCCFIDGSGDVFDARSRVGCYEL